MNDMPPAPTPAVPADALLDAIGGLTRTRLQRQPARPFAEFSEAGLLWLVNRVVFHPRGFALAFHYDDDPDGGASPTGWSLSSTGGIEPYTFHEDVDDGYFLRAEATLAAASNPPAPATETDA